MVSAWKSFVRSTMYGTHQRRGRSSLNEYKEMKSRWSKQQGVNANTCLRGSRPVGAFVGRTKSHWRPVMQVAQTRRAVKTPSQRHHHIPSRDLAEDGKRSHVSSTYPFRRLVARNYGGMLGINAGRARFCHVSSLQLAVIWSADRSEELLLKYHSLVAPQCKSSG